MNEPRYRIAVDREKIINWADNEGSWWTNYATGADVRTDMANAIRKDLDKFRIYEVKPNKDVSEVERREIIRAALVDIAESLKPN